MTIRHYNFALCDHRSDKVALHRAPAFELESCDCYHVMSIIKRDKWGISVSDEVENPDRELIGIYGFINGIINDNITDLEYVEYVRIDDRVFMLIEDHMIF